MNIRRAWLLCVWCSLVAVTATAAEWGSGKAVPPHDMFWAGPPKTDPETLFLGQFDDAADTSEEAIDDLETIGKRGGGGDDEGPGGAPAPEVKLLLEGDAKPTKEGRFGGGLLLGGKGAARANVTVTELLREAPCVTIDLWLRPEAGLQDAVLVALPTREMTPGLTLWRTAAGALVLRSGEPAIDVVTHPRQAPAEVWTYVALAWRRDLGGALFVNGTPAAWPDAGKAAIAAIRAKFGQRLLIGAHPDLTAGFRGALDGIRLTRRERLVYELADPALLDPKAERPLLKAPPYFAKEVPLPVACSFDGTVKPDQFAGIAAEGSAEAKDFRPGVRGQALDLTRAEGMGFALAGHDVIMAPQGSLEFWFKPLDWNNFYRGDFLGLDVPRLTLLRFAPKGCPGFRALRALQLVQGRSAREMGDVARWVPFHPGHWTHVVITWSDRGTVAYLDGQRQGLEQLSWRGPLHMFDTQEHDKWLKASAGKDDDTYRLTFSPSHTLVDELRVYPYAMQPEEAWNAHARFFPNQTKQLRELPFVRGEFAYDYYYQNVRLTVMCLPVNGKDPAAATVRLLAPDGGKVLLENANVALDKGLKGLCQGKVELGFATYAVEVESKAADGTTLKKVRLEYKREQPPWWQNTIGTERVVPKPWTPIKVEGESLTVTARTLTLAKGGLPAAITAAGAEVLTGPVLARATVNGAETVLTGNELKFGETAPDRVAWTGQLTGPGFTAAVSGSLEYDGLAAWRVVLEPAAGGPVDLQALSLEFPLRAAHASQLIVNGGGGNFRASHQVGMLPAGNGRVWDSKSCLSKIERGVAVGNFCPVVWLGDDDRGLCFFGENDRGWTPSADSPAQEIRRDGDTVVYRMNIISRPLKLEKPREFTFYAHPTPTKPLPAGWRSYNRQGQGKYLASYELIDQFRGFPVYSYADRPSIDISFQIEPVSWEDATALSGKLRAMGGKLQPVLMYLDYSWPKMGPSMDDYRGGLWACGRMSWNRQVEDYFTYWMTEYCRRGVIDGIYIDDTSLGRSMAPFGPGYTTDEGKPQPGFNTLGFRRFLKRLWTFCDQAGKTPHIVPHMTWCFEIPALAFASACVNGEDRDIIFPAEHVYMQTWGRDELRVMGGGDKWGFVPLWKSGLDAEKAMAAGRGDTGAWTYWQGRAMHGHLTQFDLIPMWANYAHSTFSPALNTFGSEDPQTRFLPSFKLNGEVTVASDKPGTEKDILACLFVKKGSALLMLSNYTNEDRKVTVTLDATKILGTATVAITDADCALKAPERKAATKADVKKLADNAGGDDALAGEKIGSVDETMDEIAGVSPAAKEAERLQLQIKGSTAMLVIRKYDFRLLRLGAQ